MAQTAASDAEGETPWTGRPPAQPPPEELPRVPLWQWRRNPLRRRSDLAQAWIALGRILAVLATTPAAMFLVGDGAHRHFQQTARHEASTRHETPAVLVHNAPRHPEPGSDEAKRPCIRSPSASPTPTGAPAPQTPTSNPACVPATPFAYGSATKERPPPRPSLRTRSSVAPWAALSLPLWPSLSSAPPSREPTRCTPHSCWPLLWV
ncbi:Rv1733c family protein [Streptomyces tirandamycinicus]|uniref:Rv1733c family protein n=1 Tax=Streptomyces tirandamycinicus TaxID=2174846 RepID=UPI003F745C7A